MDEIRLLSPMGMVGAGCPAESLAAGLATGPDLIGCDAGSVDPGPFHLGTGKPHHSRAAVQRDLAALVTAGRANGIPVVIGSAGTSGCDAALEWTVDIVTEVARTAGLHFTLATIRAEQDRESVKRLLRAGRMRPLLPEGEPATEAEVDSSAHIVAVMGVAPIQQALSAGADVVVAGRATDTSIFAALPLLRGFPPAVAWHAAKVLEGGAACADPGASNDSVVTRIRPDGFLVECPNPARICTPTSVAGQFLYENADLLLAGPEGILDVSAARYEAVGGGAVHVSGGRFRPAARRSAKIEAARLAGYRSIIIGGVRDPALLAQLRGVTDGAASRAADRIAAMFGARLPPDSYTLQFRVYGLDGVMAGNEPHTRITGHEAALVIDAVAPTQAMAEAVVETAVGQFQHAAFDGKRSANAGNMAYLYSPRVLDVGPTYEFCLNQLVVPADDAMFPVELRRL